MLTTQYTFQLCALLTGIILFHHIKPVFLRAIVVLLLITCINELILVRHFAGSKEASFANFYYNVFSLIDMTTWYFIFYHFFNTLKWKNVVVSGGIAIGVLSLIDLTINGWDELHSRSLILYGFFISLLSIRYLYEIFIREVHDIFSDPFFWLSAACLLYQCLLIMNFTTIYLKEYWKIDNTEAIFNILMTAANVIYYLLISVSFVICYYKQKYNKVSYP